LGEAAAQDAIPPAVSELDLSVARLVRQTLRKDRDLAPISHDVAFKVDNGVVTLRGKVPSAQDRQMVVERISQLPCVDRVDDRLEVIWP
jgi:osmotically-inducible protein OsmY